MVDILHGIAEYTHRNRTRALDLFRTFDKDRSEVLSVAQLCRLLQHTLARDVTFEQARIVMVVFHQHQPVAAPLRFSKRGAGAKYDGITYQEFVTGLRAVARDFHFVQTPSPTRLTPSATKTISRLNELTGADPGDLSSALSVIKRAGLHVSEAQLQASGDNHNRAVLEEWRAATNERRHARHHERRITDTLTKRGLNRVLRAWQRYATITRRHRQRALFLWESSGDGAAASVEAAFLRWLANARGACRARAEQSAATVSELSAKQDAQASKIARLQAQLKDANREREDLAWAQTEEREALEAKIARLEAKAADTTKRLKAAKAARDELQASVDVLERQARDADDVAATREAAKSAFAAERAELLARIEEMRSEAAERDGKLAAATASRDTLTGRVEDMQAMLERAEASLASARTARASEIDALHARVAEAENAVIETEAAAQREREAMQAEMERKERAARAQAREEGIASSRSHEEEIEALRELIAENERNLRASADALASARSSAAREKEALRAEMERSANDALAEAQESARLEKQALRAQFERKERAARAEASAEIAVAAETHEAAMESERQKFDSIRKEMERKVRDAANELAAANEAMEREKEEMRTEMEHRERAARDEAKSDALGKELDAMRAEMREKERDAGDVLAATKKAAQREKEDLHAEMERKSRDASDALAVVKEAAERDAEALRVEMLEVKREAADALAAANEAMDREKAERRDQAARDKAESDALREELDALRENMERKERDAADFLEATKTAAQREKKALHAEIERRERAAREAAEAKCADVEDTFAAEEGALRKKMEDLEREKKSLTAIISRKDEEAEAAAAAAEHSREELKEALKAENVVLSYRLLKSDRRVRLSCFWGWLSVTKKARLAEQESVQEHLERLSSDAATEQKVLRFRVHWLGIERMRRLFFRWALRTQTSQVKLRSLDHDKKVTERVDDTISYMRGNLRRTSRGGALKLFYRWACVAGTKHSAERESALATNLSALQLEMRASSFRLAASARRGLRGLFWRWASHAYANRTHTMDGTHHCVVKFARTALCHAVLGRDASVDDARLARSLLLWRTHARWRRTRLAEMANVAVSTARKLGAYEEGMVIDVTEDGSVKIATANGDGTPRAFDPESMVSKVFGDKMRSKFTDKTTLQSAFIAWRFGSMDDISNYKLVRLMEHSSPAYNFFE